MCWWGFVSCGKREINMSSSGTERWALTEERKRCCKWGFTMMMQLRNGMNVIDKGVSTFTMRWKEEDEKMVAACRRQSGLAARAEPRQRDHDPSSYLASSDCETGMRFRKSTSAGRTAARCGGVLGGSLSSDEPDHVRARMCMGTWRKSSHSSMASSSTRMEGESSGTAVRGGGVRTDGASMVGKGTQRRRAVDLRLRIGTCPPGMTFLKQPSRRRRQGSGGPRCPMAT